MIVQKNRSLNFESKFNTFRNQMLSKKNLSTSIKYRRFRKKYNNILCGAGKKVNFSRRVWCEQYEPKKSTVYTSQETIIQFWPLAVYHSTQNPFLQKGEKWTPST